MPEFTTLAQLFIFGCLGYITLMQSNTDTRFATRLIGRVMGIVMLIVFLVFVINWGIDIWASRVMISPPPMPKVLPLPR
jgi:hypothetical protein